MKRTDFTEELAMYLSNYGFTLKTDKISEYISHYKIFNANHSLLFETVSEISLFDYITDTLGLKP